MAEKNINVLFVCLGNICRSPTAHALFQAHVNKQGLSANMVVDSAGTADWHTGRPPDERTQKTARKCGYDMSHLQARQVSVQDFDEFDYILAMDHDNLSHLRAMKPAHYNGVLGLFLEEAGIATDTAVPDPYYRGEQHFQQVIQMIQDAVDGLLQRIRKDYQL